MLHANRRWSIQTIATAEELAAKVTEMTWCCCSGFQVEGTAYLFLNDATSPDGAQEYAAVKGTVERPPWLQVESLTFSWCNHGQALKLILDVTSGRYDHADFARPVNPSLDNAEVHGHCRHCR